MQFKNLLIIHKEFIFKQFFWAGKMTYQVKMLGV